LGDKVKAGLTIIARQQVAPSAANAGSDAGANRGELGGEPVAAERTE
jgi:hypothetical protein